MNDVGARPTRPAGFWIRVVAALVDGVVITIAQLSMGFVAGRIWGPAIDETPGFDGLVGAFTLLFACVYSTVAHSVTGQTIGKALVGVRVVAVDGAPLAIGAALLRWLAYFVSALPLGMGFVMAGLRTDKRALHDLVAGSRVERAAPARAVRHFIPEGGGAEPATPPWPPGGPRFAPSHESPPPRPAPPPGP